MDKTSPLSIPKICLSLTGKTISENIRTVERFREVIDIVELRVDFLQSVDSFALRTFPEQVGLPCILTMRRVADGGKSTEGESRRLITIAKALSFARPDRSGVYSYVDLENDFRVPAVEEACKSFNIKIIRSYHNMQCIPENLDDIWNAVSEDPDSLPKIAVHARNCAELVKFFNWAKTLPPREKILIAMGEFGMPSRILANRIGSMLTYTSALTSNLPAAALGHLDPLQLLSFYNFRKLLPQTSLFVLAGENEQYEENWIAKFNKGFCASSLNAVMLHIYQADLESMLGSLVGIADGIMLTGKHVKILPVLLRKVSAEVGITAYCDTLVKEKDSGTWKGYNTLVEALYLAFQEFMSCKDLHKMRVTLVGTGGFASSAACVLKRMGAQVLVVDKSSLHCKILASRFGFDYSSLSEHSLKRIAKYSDLIIRCNRGDDNELLEHYSFTGREAVMDFPINNQDTLFLDEAAAAGCHVSSGKEVFNYRARAQYTLWTGISPPPLFFA